jgi:hopanoid C-2 methylase
MRYAYAPDSIYRCFASQTEHTYNKRITPPLSRVRLNVGNLPLALVMIANFLVHIGLLADYRRSFWRMAWPALRAGRIGELIHVGLIAHHMIVFARDCARGRENASMFAKRPKLAA